jgi:hypothetical protein
MQLTKEFTPEQSRSIRKIEYDPKEQWLDITYNTGKIYRYSMFPEHKWLALLKAESAGSYVNDDVKGIFPYKLLN